MSEFEASSCRCYAAFEGSGELKPHTIVRRAVSPSDVVISIKFAGICHSDIHNVKEDWGKGITSYSPLKHYGLQAGMRFGVVGLGGLGHMGVKFGVAMGAKVTVISRGLGKKEDALNNLHAHEYLDSTDEAALATAACSFDFILDTVSAAHDVNALMGLLDLDGKYILVGLPPAPMSLMAFNFILPRRLLAGSVIGGIPETQEMLNFCGEHNITCDIELIEPSYINEAYNRTIASDVKYRFVIDTSKL